MSTTATMPSTSTQLSRVPQKRRLSEAPDNRIPDSKRVRRNNEDDLAEPSESSPLKSAAAATPSARDKKKRKKKKKKHPVVPLDADVDGAVQASVSDGPARPQAKSSHKKMRHSSVEENSTPGPSGVKRSPSASHERPRSFVPSSRTRSETLTAVSANEKGKARATSPVDTNTAPPADATALASHRALLDAVLPSLICQICLLLMSKPFALAPCGHVLCHGCLVNWFSNEPAAPLGQAVQQAEPPSAQVEGDEGENNNADDPPLAPAPALPPAERRPAPLIRRKKTCPHCRAVVREKPVEVWSVKDMVNAVVRSGLADPDSVPEYLQGDTANDATTNPWKDIFPDDTRRPFADVLNESMGLRDDEDGGIYRCVDCHHEIWDGLCSSCGRFYPGHRIEFDSDSQDDEDGLQPMWLDYSDEDEEADMDFLRHIIGRRLDDLLDDEALSEGSDHREDGRGRGSRGGSHSNESIGHGSAHSDASNDEEYEGSFIDDSDDVAIAISAVRDIGRLYRAGDDEPVEVYSDEDGRPPPARRGRRVIDSDEEISLSGGDEEDDDLAAAVAAREREMYGDDGSLPSRHFPQTDSDDEFDREYHHYPEEDEY